MRAFLFVWCLLAVSGCLRSNEINVVTPAGEKLRLLPTETLRINLSTEPPSLDPQLATDTTSSLVITNLNDGLTGYDLTENRESMKLAPALALKWESLEKARIWKFTLRPGVRWSDGVEFTPQHAIDGIKRLLAKETGSDYAYFMYGLKNGKAFNQGSATWEHVGLKQTGPWELTFELEKPMGYFPLLLAHSSTYPVRLDVIKKYGSLWTQPENIVTIGAFKLRVWQHDNLLVMERNESYYGEKAHVKYVAGYMLQELMTALNLFDSGRLDSVHKFPSIEFKKREKTPEYREAGSLLQTYYGFNLRRPPMDNVNVRKAIVSAIDKKEVAALIGGGTKPLPCWLVPGVLGFRGDVGLPFDVVKAKQYLAAAGYADPSKLPKFEMEFNTSEDNKRVIENVQAQLRRNLGIRTEIKQSEWKVYLSALKTHPPAIYRFGWVGDYADPDNFMTVMMSDSDNNHTNWKSHEYDQLVSEAGRDPDEAVRAKLYHQAETLLCERDVAVIPLVAGRNHLLVSNRVEKYPINVLERYEFKGVRLK